MSAFATAKDYEAALQLGSVSVLCKPFTRAQLRTAVRQAMECRQGFHGRLHGIGLIDLLQMLHMARRSTSLLVGGEVEGVIELREGEIVHAITDCADGEAALASLLAAAAGSVNTHPPESGTPHTIQMPFDALLLELLRRQDEANRGRSALSMFPAPLLTSSVPPRKSAPPNDGDGFGELAERVLEDCRAAGAVADTADVAAISLDNHRVLALQGDAPSEALAEEAMLMVSQARAATSDHGDGSLEYLSDGIGLCIVWSAPLRIVLVLVDEVHEGSLATWFRWRATMMSRAVLEDLFL